MTQLHYDKGRKNLELRKGDWVMINTEGVSFGLYSQQDKLNPHWFGPVEIIEIMSAINVKVALPPHIKMHSVFHVSELKKYIQPNDMSQEVEQAEPIQVNDNTNGGHVEFEVEKVINMRKVKGKRQYLILWKGYPDHDASWEPEEHVKNAKGKIKEYEATLKDRKV